MQTENINEELHSFVNKLIETLHQKKQQIRELVRQKKQIYQRYEELQKHSERYKMAYRQATTTLKNNYGTNRKPDSVVSFTIT